MAEPSAVIDMELFVDVARELASVEPDRVLTALTAAAVRRIPGAEQAGITQGMGNGFQTVAETHQLVADVDRIQYELHTGPGVDAIRYDTVFVADDLALDPRWPEFGRRASAESGVRSMLSFRLFVETDVWTNAALNLYSTELAAFSADSQRAGLVLATHGALAIAAAQARRKVANLEIALASNRDIGVAMGILMALHKVSRGAAFSLLRMASQDTHRKLAELALEVIETGVLPVRRAPVPT